MYVIVSCLAAYFSFSFCLFLSFAVSERFGWLRGAGEHFIGFMWSLWRMIGMLCCWDYHFYLYSFKKTIIAIPWISHISVLYIFIASSFVRTIILHIHTFYSIKTLHTLTSESRKFSHNTHTHAQIHRERERESSPSLTRADTHTHAQQTEHIINTACIWKR